MSKVIRLCFVTLFLIPFCIAPFVAIRPVRNFYEENHRLVREYECYPIETCNFDFNGDGKTDPFRMDDRPSGNAFHDFRLVIMANHEGFGREILNIRYDQTDGSLRTHVAVLEENDLKKLVIYDTINAHQFFFWDGNQLAPAENTSLLEREIRQAMELTDDTGRRQQSAVYVTIAALFLLYYGVLFAGTAGYFYLRRKYVGRFL